MADGMAHGEVVRMRKLKYLRRGRKSAVTNRVKCLEGMIEESGSKRQMLYLLDGLHTLFEDLEKACMEIAGLEEEQDEYNDIEDYRHKVEMCTASINEHLQMRREQGEESSEGSLTSSWVRKHAVVVGGECNSGSETEGDTEVKSQVSSEYESESSYFSESVSGKFSAPIPGSGLENSQGDIQTTEGESVDALTNAMRHLPAHPEHQTSALEMDDPLGDSASRSGSSDLLDSTIIPGNVSSGAHSSPISHDESRSLALVSVRKRDSVVASADGSFAMDDQQLRTIWDGIAPITSNVFNPLTQNSLNSIYGSSDHSTLFSNTQLPGDTKSVWSPSPKNFEPKWRESKEIVEEDGSSDVENYNILPSSERFLELMGGAVGGRDMGSGNQTHDPPGNAAFDFNFSRVPMCSGDFPLCSGGFPSDARQGISSNFETLIPGQDAPRFPVCSGHAPGPVDGPGRSPDIHTGVSGVVHPTSGGHTTARTPAFKFSTSNSGGGGNNLLTTFFPTSGSKSARDVGGGLCLDGAKDNQVVAPASSFQPNCSGGARDLKEKASRVDGGSQSIGLNGPARVDGRSQSTGLKGPARVDGRSQSTGLNGQARAGGRSHPAGLNGPVSRANDGSQFAGHNGLAPAADSRRNLADNHQPDSISRMQSSHLVKSVAVPTGGAASSHHSIPGNANHLASNHAQFAANSTRLLSSFAPPAGATLGSQNPPVVVPPLGAARSSQLSPPVVVPSSGAARSSLLSPPVVVPLSGAVRNSQLSPPVVVSPSGAVNRHQLSQPVFVPSPAVHVNQLSPPTFVPPPGGTPNSRRSVQSSGSCSAGSVVDTAVRTTDNSCGFVPGRLQNSVVGSLQRATSSPAKNDVDSWIDDLDFINQPSRVNVMQAGVGPEVLMASLMQQYLPQVTLPKFSGAPLEWVEFIVKFRDVVHCQPFLTNTQKNQLLMQHLHGEAKKSVKGYANDSNGYVMALKTLKHLFGQRSAIARATLRRITKGKNLGNDDVKELVDMFYQVNECLVTLKQLNYVSDLYSSDTLNQVKERLPMKLKMKWSERCLVIRRSDEPNLVHFCDWLQDRVLALKEMNPDLQRKAKGEKHVNLLQGSSPCPLCQGAHLFWKCPTYQAMDGKGRMEYVRSLKVCFNCFRDGHRSPVCNSPNRCFTSGCNKKHHTTLHIFFTDGGGSLSAVRKNRRTDGKKHSADQKKALPADSNKDGDGNAAAPDNEQQVMCLTKSTPTFVYLLIVPVTIHAGGKKFDTYALLDDASQATLLRDDVADYLGLSGEETEVSVSMVMGASAKMRVPEVSLEVSARNGKNRLLIENAQIQPVDKFNMPSRPRLQDVCDDDVFTHLDDLHFDAVEPSQVTLLIGANAPEAQLYSSVRKGKKGQPLALKTMFGWTLFGPSGVQSGRKDVHCSTMCVEKTLLDAPLQSLWTENEPRSLFVNVVMSTPEDQTLHHSLERFWTQENLGILPPKDVALSQEDVRALEKMESEAKLVSGRYQVPMLWNKSVQSLPNNYPLALKRFKGTQRRLRGDSQICAKFKEVIDGYLHEVPPRARKMTPDEASITGPKTCYLPLHPVTNPNKPGKVRVTNDAAAEYAGTSLNKSLLSGPDLLNSLIGVLMRFRNNKIAIGADVEAMFHQVRVSDEDADSLRFLWNDDVMSNKPPDTYQMLVHVFGARDSATCANYALKRTARDNAANYDAVTLETALKSFYVDDVLKSVETVEAAITLALQLISMMKSGGFRLTKFVSNSPKVLEALPASEVSPSATISIDTDEHIERALGISWETVLDLFTFRTHLKDAPATKRGILRLASLVFDPLGFLTPFILLAKLLLQELWRLGYDWDQDISDDLAKTWRNWVLAAENITAVKIQRCYNLDDRPVNEIQLHVFCDASEKAYGCVAYVRFSFKSGGHSCALVMSKSRLAPIKTISLPRLELCAASCGARMGHLILQEIDLPIQRVQYWSDSTLALQYINNVTSRLKIFFANRVTGILELSDRSQWRHIPGTLNPSDVLTRGVEEPVKLMRNRWFTGPEFLDSDEEMWPVLDVAPLDPTDTEIKKKSVLLVVAQAETKSINFFRFSNWLRLRRVVCYVLRFIHATRTPEDERNYGSFDATDLQVAENHIIRDVQQEEFQDEISTLADGKPLQTSNRLSPLCPFVDETGTLRVGGRLKDLPLPLVKKHPPILPGQHPVTKIIVEWIHRRNGHVGPEHVLSELRESYWITSARTVVRQVSEKCFFCRVRRARLQFPFMANLPVCRAAIDAPPFDHCGVDLFGPIEIKQGRKRLKRWGVLYTCMTVRCIHLEVVESCETDDFINALRRFTNRRGCPSTMYSDNGTNFRGATSELKEFVVKLEKEKEKIVDEVSQFKINWKFNPPKAPHMGGAWERLIRSTKEVMQGLMGDRVLTDSQLYTLFTDVEHIVNSRPLTHLSTDPNDFEPLTPNHILLGQHRNWSSITDISAVDISSRRRWKQVQALRSLFWSRWVKEYLPTLTVRPSSQRTEHHNHKEGDLVLLFEKDLKREKWPLARVEKVMPGKDGVVRVVNVRTKDGSYTRPAAKVLRLEDEEFDVRQGGE